MPVNHQRLQGREKRKVLPFSPVPELKTLCQLRVLLLVPAPDRTHLLATRQPGRLLGMFDFDAEEFDIPFERFSLPACVQLSCSVFELETVAKVAAVRLTCRLRPVQRPARSVSRVDGSKI